jgi:hypothetical protein
MTLIVEGGSGLPDAESYASVADAVLYAVSHGLNFAESPEDDAEAALRRATTWIDGRFGGRFTGVKANGREQALQWPRKYAKDSDGFEIASDEVPDEIIRATCEAACRELASPGALSPDVKAGEVITAASVSGAVSVQYALNTGVDGQRPIATVIDDILAGLIGQRPGQGAGYIGRQDRA